LALLQKAKGKKNIFQKGFTLVELMTVIVIVGILSAVALPSFLSQASKAKGTEARSQISSIMKDAAAIYQQDGAQGLVDIMTEARGTADNCVYFGAPADVTGAGTNAASSNTKFDYGCTLATGSDDLTVVATANANDSRIQNNKVTMVLDLEDGTITTTQAATSKMFGGQEADAS
jgi:type IV pilus assembly protein PilA